MEGRKGRKELGGPNTGGGVPEAPVEAEEREGEGAGEVENNFAPVELWGHWAGAGEGAGRLGGWGVGSRLMLAMGWQVGQGLGREGQGRVEPTVPAWVYPQGKSIDWCMEAREEERRRRRRVEEEVVAYPSGKRVNIAWVREDGPCGRLGRLRRVPL